MQLLDESGAQRALLGREVHHQLERVALGAQRGQDMIVEPAPRALHDVAREALGHQRQRQTPLDLVEPLQDARLDRESPQAAAADLRAILFAERCLKALPLLA